MRWIFKKIFQWSDPDGKKVIMAIRDDCVVDILVEVQLSMKEDPDKWHNLIDNFDRMKLFEMVKIKQYLMKPRTYKFVRPEDIEE